MKIFVIIFVLFLNACRLYTMEGYKQEILGKYYGADYERLMIDYGLPTNTLNLGGIFLIVYDKKEVYYVPKTTTSTTKFEKAQYNPYLTSTTNTDEIGGFYQEWRCRTTFYLRNGKVFDVKLEGNNCFRQIKLWN